MVKGLCCCELKLKLSFSLSFALYAIALKSTIAKFQRHRSKFFCQQRVQDAYINRVYINCGAILDSIFFDPEVLGSNLAKNK